MRSNKFNKKIFSLFPLSSTKLSLTGLMSKLYDQQYQTWPLLRKNYNALLGVKTRNIRCNGHNVTVQWNPERIVSSTANIDKQEIAARPCFLCVDNLPEKQRTIFYGDTLLILCNPFPIFHHHFTISSISHTIQEFEPNIPFMLDLAELLDSRFTVFYNGPQCGASAPDHFHFQAVPSGILGVEKLTADLSGRKAVVNLDTATVSLFNNIGCPYFLIQGVRKDSINNRIITIIKELRFLLTNDNKNNNDNDIDTEPMINVLATFCRNQWQIFLFPRAAHRPSLYYAKGEEKKIISPASIDISGFIITPRQEDFDSLTSEQTERIFKEVSIPVSKLYTIMQRIDTND